MPSHPQQNGTPRETIERLFLGLPEETVLPQFVGAKKQWAEGMAETVRRASGDETISVAIARIGNRLIQLPEPQPGGDPLPDSDLPGSGHGQVGAENEQAQAPRAAPTDDANLRVKYTDTEPVIVVTLDTSKLGGFPAWVSGLDVRVVDRPEAEIIPSSFPITSIDPDRPIRLGGGQTEGSVFESSLSSGVTLAIIAGGFGAAYYLFGPENSSG